MKTDLFHSNLTSRGGAKQLVKGESQTKWQRSSVRLQLWVLDLISLFLPSVSHWEPQSSRVPAAIQTVQTFKWHWQSKSLLPRRWQQQLLIVLSIQGKVFRSDFYSISVVFFILLLFYVRHKEPQKEKKKTQRETVNGRHCFRDVEKSNNLKGKVIFWHALSCPFISVHSQGCLLFFKEQRSFLPGWTKGIQRIAGQDQYLQSAAQYSCFQQPRTQGDEIQQCVDIQLWFIVYSDTVGLNEQQQKYTMYLSVSTDSSYLPLNVSKY